MILNRVLCCMVVWVMAPAYALEDPTRPLSLQAQIAAQPVGKEFSLDSIMIGHDRRVAVIDGIARQEGDTFEGTRLLRIFPDKVELKEQGRTQTLEWTKPPAVRSPR